MIIARLSVLLVDLYCRSIEPRDEKDTCLKIYTYIFIFALGIYFYICVRMESWKNIIFDYKIKWSGKRGYTKTWNMLYNSKTGVTVVINSEQVRIRRIRNDWSKRLYISEGKPSREDTTCILTLWWGLPMHSTLESEWGRHNYLLDSRRKWRTEKCLTEMLLI